MASRCRAVLKRTYDPSHQYEEDESEDPTTSQQEDEDDDDASDDERDSDAEDSGDESDMEDQVGIKTAQVILHHVLCAESGLVSITKNALKNIAANGKLQACSLEKTLLVNL